VTFALFTLGIFAVIGIFTVAVFLTIWDRRRKAHGRLIIIARWLAGIPHHGKAVTDATLFKAGTRPLTRTGHASRFQHRPVIQRAAMRSGPLLTIPFIAYGLVVNTRPAAGYTALTGAAAAVYGAWRAAQWARTRQHRRHWLEPAHRALAVEFGHALALAPRTWLALAPDRSEARLAIGHGKVLDANDQMRLASAAITKLGITGADPREDAEWKQHGLQPHLTISRPVPCPPLVTLTDVADAIRAAKRDEVVIGIGKRGIVTKVSLAINAPHMLASFMSGVGKSTFAKLAVAPRLYMGDVALMLDVKQWSHPWFFGLPNVAYASGVERCFLALMWLGDPEQGEIERRNTVAARHVDNEGRLRPGALEKIGPRILVVVEEQNELMTRLRRWWESKGRHKYGDIFGDYSRCPAIDALDSAHFTARQVFINVVDIGQMVTARAAGSTEARENTAGIRILGQPTPAHWKMLVAQHSYPSNVKPHPGRVFVVTADAVRETQVAMLTGEEARSLALGGIVAQCPRGMPYRAWDPRVASTPVSAALDVHGPDQPNYQPQPVPVTGPAGGVTLSEAVEKGLLRTSIHNARMLRNRRRHGKNDMPLPVGKRGTADVWDPVELADWWGMREARRMTEKEAA
jgi:hypothetical protein